MQNTISNVIKLTRSFLSINNVTSHPMKNIINSSLFSTSTINLKDKEISHWMKYNDIIFPPQGPTEKRRPAVSFYSSY